MNECEQDGSIMPRPVSRGTVCTLDNSQVWCFKNKSVHIVPALVNVSKPLTAHAVMT